MLIGQIVQTLTYLPRPSEDSLHQAPLLGSTRLLSLVVVQLRPGALQPLGDVPPLMVELDLGDLSRHEQPDGPVLFHPDASHILLSLCNLLLQPTAVLGIQRVDACDDQVGVLKHPLDLLPHRLFQPLGTDVGAFSALDAKA